MKAEVAVIGGGLAGCAIALELAAAGIQVALIEESTYPSHKLCGEFLSPEVQGYFASLRIADAVERLKPATANFSRVSTSGGAHFESPLPAPALGLSRFALDALLFRRAEAAGAVCLEGTGVRNVEGNHRHGFELETTGPPVEARFVVGAFGKRSTVERELRPATLERQSPLVAFKQHFEGRAVESVRNAIELHGFPGGYCGLMCVEGERVNACWITSADVLKEAGGTPEDMIRVTLSANERLAERFSALVPVPETRVAISQISFRRKGLFERDVMMIGDAAAMIAPLCGDGMAMALRSARMAAPLISRHLAGALPFDRLRREYRSAWRREFSRRLALGRIIHRVYSNSLMATAGVKTIAAFPALGRWVIRETRE